VPYDLLGAKITMSGDERCRDLQEALTRRHPWWKLIQNKRWGMALLCDLKQFNRYLKDANHRLRRHSNRASKASFTFARKAGLVDAFARFGHCYGQAGEIQRPGALPSG
jgi:hypothetical protein